MQISLYYYDCYCRHMSSKYFFYKNTDETLSFSRGGNFISSIRVKVIKDALVEFDRVMQTFEKTEIPIGQILGLRNLSAFVGEVFNLAISKSTNLLLQNPHQDGYPDLLGMDDKGIKLWKKLKPQIREKSPFSPFKLGGLEVKATCGDLKTAKWFSSKGLQKCEIGDQRIDYVTNYNWKAHHRETNNLIGIIWDFIDEKPNIVLVAYSNKLTEEDWGKTVTPKEGGGRTTSVSIMNRQGISKMFSGRVCVVDKEIYKNKVEEKIKKYF